MTFDEWHEIGMNNKWCSDIFCMNHELAFMTKEECKIFDDGYDICIFVIRLLPIDEQ